MKELLDNFLATFVLWKRWLVVALGAVFCFGPAYLISKKAYATVIPLEQDHLFRLAVAASIAGFLLWVCILFYLMLRTSNRRLKALQKAIQY